MTYDSLRSLEIGGELAIHFGWMVVVTLAITKVYHLGMRLTQKGHSKGVKDD